MGLELNMSSPPALGARAGVGVEEILAAAKLKEIVEAAKRHSKSIFFSTRDPSQAELLAAEGVQILRVVYSYYYGPMAAMYRLCAGYQDWEWSDLPDHRLQGGTGYAFCEAVKVWLRERGAVNRSVCQELLAIGEEYIGDEHVSWAREIGRANVFYSHTLSKARHRRDARYT